MKNIVVLRLVWENINGDVCEHEMPMLDWVLDWWGACEMVPANNDLVHLAEMDGRRFDRERDMCAMVPGERARIGGKPPMTRILKTVWRRYEGCKIAI